MIVEPKIRGFICTTAHPVGCAQHVQEQIDIVKSHPPLKNFPQRVLVIGASTGYGLASRIAAAFGGNAKTIGVFFEKAAEKEGRTATAGWYNSAGFEQKAHAVGLYAKSFNGDAFSDEMRQKVIETIKRDWGQVDLIIYSLASPRRQDPKTGVLYKSVLRPIGQPYSNNSIDMSKDKLEIVSLPVATQDEIDQTVKVMGGEDWELWIEALEKEKLLAPGCSTVAYSYIGPEVTTPVYRNGTIGRAKEHLEATSLKLDKKMRAFGGRAFISVNKALVTQSSSAIPFIPLYFIILSKVMKEKGVEEGCIEQIFRLFNDCLSQKVVPVDESGFIRLDDHEMRRDIQDIVMRNWNLLNQENLSQHTDLDGYHVDFLKLFGFGLKGVDYATDVTTLVAVPSIK